MKTSCTPHASLCTGTAALFALHRRGEAIPIYPSSNWSLHTCCLESSLVEFYGSAKRVLYWRSSSCMTKRWPVSFWHFQDCCRYRLPKLCELPMPFIHFEDAKCSLAAFNAQSGRLDRSQVANLNQTLQEEVGARRKRRKRQVGIYSFVGTWAQYSMSKSGAHTLAFHKVVTCLAYGPVVVEEWLEILSRWPFPHAASLIWKNFSANRNWHKGMNSIMEGSRTRQSCYNPFHCNWLRWIQMCV